MTMHEDDILTRRKQRIKICWLAGLGWLIDWRKQMERLRLDRP